MARILVSDDDDSVRGLVCRALALDGHEVEGACDGAEALEALGRTDYDLLLSDIRMPVMDGIALALAAARERPNLVILLMTGFADQRERAAGLDALIHDVLTKPFGLSGLRAAVTAALGSRPVAV
ncbi:MAG TPA: response regulator [Hyphomicrobiales bacterium]|nr:response regulator [Hyphomicrobiales bacterium]